MSTILVLNTGSSSVKFALTDQGRELLSGQIKNLPEAAEFELWREGEREEPRTLPDATSTEAALSLILDRVLKSLNGKMPDAAGHRVVHGGPFFKAATRITPKVRQRIEQLVPLAPLHQPSALVAIDAVEKHLPGVLQTASFDTSFHRSQPTHAQLYALPQELSKRGILRYGFHGLSYDHIAATMDGLLPPGNERRIVAAHLGSGASLCAMKGGQSVATSMGFSALDGLPMSTRCGDLDPGALLFLIRHEGLSPEHVEDLLYTESGLQGLSGLGTGDIRVLLEHRDEPPVALAIEHFVHRIRLGIGEMTAALGGIDALVFTGGIGENAAEIRARVLEGLGFLGLVLCPDRNARNAAVISADTGDCPAHVIKADEEAVIRRDAEIILACESEDRHQ